MKKLISFATPQYHNASIRFQYEANCIGAFDEIKIFTELDFDSAYLEEFGPWINNNPRGFGYWIWKSYFVKKSIVTMEKGDVLVYADVGCAINYLCKKKLQYYFDLTSKSQLGLVCFNNGYVEKEWDKGDAIDFFSSRGVGGILNTFQIMGGVWIIKICDNSIKLLSDWFDIIHNNLSLVDDSPSRSPNEFGFKENRHDQTIFSLLVKNTGGAIVLPAEEVEVKFEHRKEGWMTYRRYKHNVFLAIRDTDGIIYNSHPIPVLIRNIKCNIIMFKEEVYDKFKKVLLLLSFPIRQVK